MAHARLGQREQRRETARVVADAGAQNPVAFPSNVEGSVGREHGIEMRADDDARAAFGVAVAPEHVANLVGAYVLQADRREPLGGERAPARFAERRRGDGGDGALEGEGVGVPLLDPLAGGDDVGAGEEFLDAVGHKRG